MLIDYLNKKYGEDALSVISQNALYYILGDKYVEFDNSDITSIKRRRAIMALNQNALLKITEWFYSNEINYINFKGVVLSNRLYNNSTSRNAGDIDIFVNKKDYCAGISFLYHNNLFYLYLFIQILPIRFDNTLIPVKAIFFIAV